MAVVTRALPPQPRGAVGATAAWRSFKTAVRLGWVVEANWTDPFLFFVYSVAKPVASALILVFMVDVISGGRADALAKAFVIIGTALWSFVTVGIAGLAQSLLEDRERYRMLKYLYVSPNQFIVITLGRGTARIGIAVVAAVITLGFGVIFLNVPFSVGAVDWLLLVLSSGLGLIGVLSLALLLGATIMQTRQDAWSYPEAVAGGLFLMVGAVFPMSVLPAPVQIVGLITPLSWWLEGTRQALFPGVATAIGGPGSVWTSWTGSAAPSPAQIVAMLAITTAVFAVIGLVAFNRSERRARQKGLLDLLSGS
jgi:ABC-2 type transport system permease protein